jgi:hypothetical protein
MREILLVYREVALQNQGSGGLTPVIVTVSVDEKPGLQAIANTAPDLPPVPGKHATTARDHEYNQASGNMLDSGCIGSPMMATSLDESSGVTGVASSSRCSKIWMLTIR